MYKACSRCGKIHKDGYVCTHNKPKYDYSKYGSGEERQLRNTTEWHKKAEQVKEEAQYLCEVCRDNGVYNYRDLEVHHIIKLREDKSGLLNDYNLICLCVKHHKMADRAQLDRVYLTSLAEKRVKKALDV